MKRNLSKLVLSRARRFAGFSSSSSPTGAGPLSPAGDSSAGDTPPPQSPSSVVSSPREINSFNNLSLGEQVLSEEIELTPEAKRTKLILKTVENMHLANYWLWMAQDGEFIMPPKKSEDEIFPWARSKEAVEAEKQGKVLTIDDKIEFWEKEAALWLDDANDWKEAYENPSGSGSGSE